jgi:hypothetical protein
MALGSLYLGRPVIASVQGTGNAATNDITIPQKVEQKMNVWRSMFVLFM